MASPWLSRWLPGTPLALHSLFPNSAYSPHLLARRHSHSKPAPRPHSSKPPSLTWPRVPSTIVILIMLLELSPVCQRHSAPWFTCTGLISSSRQSMDRTVCSGHRACSVLKLECKSQGPGFSVQVLRRYFVHPRSVKPLLCIKFLLFRVCNPLFYFSPFLLYLSTFKKTWTQPGSHAGFGHSVQPQWGESVVSKNRAASLISSSSESPDQISVAVMSVIRVSRYQRLSFCYALRTSWGCCLSRCPRLEDFSHPRIAGGS